MNIELRKTVLEKSLLLEYHLSKILALLFRVEKDGSQTLGVKGTSISFKTKADFLLDLGRIDSKFYQDLILFMEVRNQFMHNMDADSFNVVVQRVNKKNRLLQIDEVLTRLAEQNPDRDREELYNMGFTRLFLNIGEKIDAIDDEIRSEIKQEEAAKIYQASISLYDEAIDEFAREFNEQWEKQKGGKSEMDSVIKSGIRRKLKEKLEIAFNHKFNSEQNII